MQPVIIITVLRLYARPDDSSDGAWLLFRSTSSSFRAPYAHLTFSVHMGENVRKGD